MDKEPTKFLLPSPNFNKAIQNAAASKLHYLTPSGMCLLPREKQPPPMYGPRGATVPSKFLQQPKNHQSSFQNTVKCCDQSHDCSACKMTFQTGQELRRHEQHHEKCPIDDCNFHGHSTIMDKHVEQDHAAILKTFTKKKSTPEELASWVLERKKRYPTVENVLLLQRAKEQRQQRGERLENSKKRFGHIADRKLPEECSKTKKNFRKKKTLKKQKPSKVAKKPKDNEKPREIELTAVKFKGTANMTDYVHCNIKHSEQSNVLLDMLGMYGTDDSEDGSQPETENTNNTDMANGTKLTNVEPKAHEFSLANTNKITKNTNLIDSQSNAFECNALSCKTGFEFVSNYEDESSDEAPEEKPIVRDVNQNKLVSQNAISNEKSCDVVPDEEPILHVIQPLIENTCKNKMNPSHENKKPAFVKTHLKTQNNFKAIDRSVKRRSGLNYRASYLSKQNTLLAKLLKDNMRHERNVLLQCVRFVCENGYFNVGNIKDKHSK